MNNRNDQIVSVKEKSVIISPNILGFTAAKYFQRLDMILKEITEFNRTLDS